MTRLAASRRTALLLAAALAALGACSKTTSSNMQSVTPNPAGPPSPDPRVGLKAGLFNAQEASWNMRLVSTTPPSQPFMGRTNSDLAFSGNYAIQGNYNGYQVWDISNPVRPTLVKGLLCPESQSDVSVYRNLLVVSGEGLNGRLDCGTTSPTERISTDRLRGVRIFDVSDWNNPRQVAAVQTCRGSHTHTLLVPQNDPDNIYVYISGSSPVRPGEELAGCTTGQPGDNPQTALFRIEVIKVPLAHPEQAAIVNSPRIFNDLTEAHSHGLAPADRRDLEEARARGAFIAEFSGQQIVLPDQFSRTILDSISRSNNHTSITAEDSAQLRRDMPIWVARRTGTQPGQQPTGPRPGPTQCHDITVFPAVGLAGGACEGYGFLLDISNPANPVRIGAVSDTNFSYWHSATFNNDGTKILFSDEWGGGGGPKCRADDPMQWGGDAIFTIENRQMVFHSYYKMPAAQTKFENCVAHNGSLIPIPGRDVMVQSWYQGGVSIFDWTDAAHPREIAFYDRGPADSTRMASGGTWSVYWYNGVMVSSEIARGLDVFELLPSGWISQNEIDAAKTAHLDYLNTQGQQQYTWPASFALARAYTDQLQRSGGLSNVNNVRHALASAESASGSARSTALTQLASQLDGEAGSSRDGAKVRLLAGAVRELASGTATN